MRANDYVTSVRMAVTYDIAAGEKRPKHWKKQVKRMPIH